MAQWECRVLGPRPGWIRHWCYPMDICYSRGGGVVLSAIQWRDRRAMYAGGEWIPYLYSIDGAQDNVPVGASITATTVDESGGSTVLLAYVAKSGFLTVQARG